MPQLPLAVRRLTDARAEKRALPRGRGPEATLAGAQQQYRRTRPAAHPGGYDCSMEPPGITRHRRPFLAPLWVGLLGAVVIGAIGWAYYRSATATVVFLARPVEKDPGAIDDPPVSPEGEARAQRLAQMFGGSGGGGRVDAIYVSDDRRAQQTAAPLAERLHRAPVVFGARDTPAAAARMLREHPGGTVVVIAGGRTLPQMIHELSGATPPAAGQDEPDLIYIVSIPSFGRAHLARIRL